jgi:hypothetical protein
MTGASRAHMTRTAGMMTDRVREKSFCRPAPRWGTTVATMPILPCPSLGPVFPVADKKQVAPVLLPSRRQLAPRRLGGLSGPARSLSPSCDGQQWGDQHAGFCPLGRTRLWRDVHHHRRVIARLVVLQVRATLLPGALLLCWPLLASCVQMHPPALAGWLTPWGTVVGVGEGAL